VEQNAQYWIDRLNLQAHPEGGHYREVYRAEDRIQAEGLPNRYGGSRSASTAIYYLLTSDEFSTLHRIQSDEVWHFHTGSPLTVHAIEPGGEYQTYRLGLNLDDGQEPMAVVAAGCWFGATVEEPNTYALVSCTVAPGFDFEDFELANREHLIRQYPQHTAIIERLTR